MAFHEIKLTVNGRLEQVRIPSNMTLMRMLRESLALTGADIDDCPVGLAVLFALDQVMDLHAVGCEFIGVEQRYANERQGDPRQEAQPCAHAVH